MHNAGLDETQAGIKIAGRNIYNLNQIPYEYIVEVVNRFKGYDLIERVPEELWMEWNAGLDEAQIGIKTARRNINNPRYTEDTTLVMKSKEEL